MRACVIHWYICIQAKFGTVFNIVAAIVASYVIYSYIHCTYMCHNR